MTAEKTIVAKKVAAEKKRQKAYVAHLRAQMDCLDNDIALLAVAEEPLVEEESEFQPPRHGPGAAAMHHERALLKEALDAVTPV